MQITNAQWTDATRTMVRAEIDGAVSFIPADATGNAHFAHLLALGEGVIAEPAEEEATPPRPTLDDLTAENEAEPQPPAKRPRKMSA